MNIVVAEDDAGIRQLIRKALEKDGHNISEARDGIQGLALVRAKKPNLIICDQKMPNMTGDRMLTSVRDLGLDYQVIPFLFLSANSDETAKIERLNGGADGVFIKPLNFPLLRAHVNACLANSRRHSQFFEQKLETISKLLSSDPQHSFDHFAPLGDSVDQYLDSIRASIEKVLALNELVSVQQPQQAQQAHAAALHFNSSRKEANNQPLAYVRFCLGQLERRRDLVTASNSESLTWWLIFTVAEAQLADEALFVSDLYFSTPSAKTTINSRMNLLIEKDILMKHDHPSDGRRQQLKLSPGFQHTFDRHILDSIKILEGFLPFSRPRNQH